MAISHEWGRRINDLVPRWFHMVRVSTLTVVWMQVNSHAVASQAVRPFEQLVAAVTIRPEGPGYSLARPRSSLLLPSGEIFLIEGADATVLRFGGNGALLGSFGTRGGGPGEFRDPAGLGVHGDSLLVWDPASGRVSLFTRDGRLVRTIPVRAPGVGALLPDGRLVTVNDREYGGSGELAQQWFRVIARDSLGAPLDTVFARARRYRTLRVQHAAGGTTVGSQPFDDGPLAAISPDGRLILWVDRETSGNGLFGVTLADFRGTVRYARRLPYEPVRITREHVRAATSWLMRPGALPAEFERALHVPASLPTVTQAFLLLDGSVILRREESFGGRARYTVLDPDGRVVADLDVPPHVAIVSGSARRLLLRVRDVDGLSTYQVVAIR